MSQINQYDHSEEGNVIQLDFSSSGRFMFTLTDTHIMVNDTLTGKTLSSDSSTIGENDQLTCMGMAPDPFVLALGAQDGAVRVRMRVEHTNTCVSCVCNVLVMAHTDACLECFRYTRQT